MARGVSQECGVHPSLRLGSLTVAVAECEHALLGQALLDLPEVPVAPPIVHGIDPDSVCEQCRARPGMGVHRVENLREHRPKFPVERLPATRCYGSSEPDHFRLGEVDGRKRGAAVDNITTTRSRPGTHRKASVLEGTDIPLHRADADLEQLSQLLGRSAARTRSSQLLPSGEQSAGSVHLKMVTYR